MASIGKDPNGYRRILFVAGDGSRKTIRLGKATAKQAEAFKVKLEALATGAITGSIDDETARWLAALDETMHARLAAVGLVKARNVGGRGLGAFIHAYIADRTDAKPATLVKLKETRAKLVSFVGENRDLREVTEGDADMFWRHLLREGLALNSVRRTCGRAKQFFRAAIRKRLIHSNPFADVKCHVQGNTDRDFLITRDMAAKVIDACPDAQWRLLFALSRFGGLRCPSEHLALKWGDVDWDKGRITVTSPKTEHHEGKGSRIIPLFPELRPYLMEVFEQAEPGAVHVITRYRDKNQNLRTQFERIIRKAGLTPWPKLFHNLRGTRETELAETYPIHVVCAWIGNSERIAQKHYLQITDDHFTRGSDEGGTQAAQIPAQQPAEMSGNDRKSPRMESEKTTIFPVDSVDCRNLQNLVMAPVGLEPTLV